MIKSYDDSFLKNEEKRKRKREREIYVFLNESRKCFMEE